jgi:hypothetical protein
MHFDGVTEQLCKVTRHRLKKFLECRSKWAKLKCQQAEIAKKSYENIDDGSVNSYIEKNPDTINLEWNHHMKCWKRFCNEEKIRRKQRKEKGEGTSSKTITSTQAVCALRPQCITGKNIKSVICIHTLVEQRSSDFT